MTIFWGWTWFSVCKDSILYVKVRINWVSLALCFKRKQNSESESRRADWKDVVWFDMTWFVPEQSHADPWLRPPDEGLRKNWVRLTRCSRALSLLIADWMILFAACSFVTKTRCRASYDSLTWLIFYRDPDWGKYLLSSCREKVWSLRRWTVQTHRSTHWLQQLARAATLFMQKILI